MRCLLATLLAMQEPTCSCLRRLVFWAGGAGVDSWTSEKSRWRAGVGPLGGEAARLEVGAGQAGGGEGDSSKVYTGDMDGSDGMMKVCLRGRAALGGDGLLSGGVKVKVALLMGAGLGDGDSAGGDGMAAGG